MMQGRGGIYHERRKKPRTRISLARRISWTGVLLQYQVQGRIQQHILLQLRLCTDVWFHLDNLTGHLPEWSLGWRGEGNQEKNMGDIQGRLRQQTFGSEEGGEGDGRYLHP